MLRWPFRSAFPMSVPRQLNPRSPMLMFVVSSAVVLARATVAGTDPPLESAYPVRSSCKTVSVERLRRQAHGPSAIGDRGPPGRGQRRSSIADGILPAFFAPRAGCPRAGPLGIPTTGQSAPRSPRPPSGGQPWSARTTRVKCMVSYPRPAVYSPRAPSSLLPNAQSWQDEYSSSSPESSVVRMIAPSSSSTTT
jgi:hypothetical protein